MSACYCNGWSCGCCRSRLWQYPHFGHWYPPTPIWVAPIQLMPPLPPLPPVVPWLKPLDLTKK